MGSFQICQMVLPDLHRLGLAIGLEHGTTPIIRLGIRGERSVRVASSVACCQSEREQKSLSDNGVKLSPNARMLLPVSLGQLFDRQGSTVTIDYDDVCASSAAGITILPPTVYTKAPASLSNQFGRTHFKV